MFHNPFSKDNQKVTIYKTHDRKERDLFAGRLKKAGIWCQTRDSEMARNTASFGSNFIDIQKVAGDPRKGPARRPVPGDGHPADMRETLQCTIRRRSVFVMSNILSTSQTSVLLCRSFVLMDF